MSNASLGRNTEYRVRDHLITQGWKYIMHAAASKGSGDLLMGHAIHGGALVQVGRKSKTLGPADRNRLLDDCELIGAIPLLAIVIPRQPITYWVVSRDKPATWERWGV